MAQRSPRDDLLNNLFYELFQTERSAERHSLREAERLGSTAPALALRAVSGHARQLKPSLEELAQSSGFSWSTAGKAIGDLFSEVRERAVDHTISLERSYRATLIGMRHGVDLVHSIKNVAKLSGRSSIESWCENWLVARTPLVEAVAAELDWFAQNPETALQPASFPSLGLRLKRSESSSN